MLVPSSVGVVLEDLGELRCISSCILPKAARASPKIGAVVPLRSNPFSSRTRTKLLPEGADRRGVDVLQLVTK